jgi:hypothetical protein
MLVRRLAFALLFVSATASAQQAAAKVPVDCDDGPNDVCSANRSPTGTNQALEEASLGDSLSVKLREPAWNNSVPSSQAANGKKITLYLNGRDTKITPDIYDAAKHQLTFRLERTADNKDIWTALLRDPYKGSHRNVLVTVGVADSPPLTSAASFTLVVVKWAWYAWLWILLLIIVLIAFFRLAAKRDILRDGAPVNGTRQPYSLGKSQMAWWFFLIIIGFVMIWLISGDRDTVTASLLTLMGISAGTGLGSSLIERNAKNHPPAPAAGAVPAAPPPPPPPAVSRGWLQDILSDSNGSICLHRLQIVLWTFVLGIMLIVAVVTSLTMPVFNDTLVTLMGISSGTYVGFKFAED